MLERGAELKRNAAREPSYPMVPAGFSCITHDFIGELLSHQAQCLSASSLWSTFSAALTRPCVDRYHVSTTSEGKSTGAEFSLCNLEIP